MTGPLQALRPGPVGLDTPLFIYFIEEHPRYAPLVDPLFRAIDSGFLQGITSGVTLLETLIHPLRNRNQQLAEEYEAILTQSRNLSILELTVPLLRAAAQLRAATGMKTPDALQIAAATAMQCTAFVTNDRRLPEIPGLRILQLEDWAD